MRRRNVDASQIQVNNNPIDDLSVHARNNFNSQNVVG